MSNIERKKYRIYQKRMNFNILTVFRNAHYKDKKNTIFLKHACILKGKRFTIYLNRSCIQVGVRIRLRHKLNDFMTINRISVLIVLGTLVCKQFIQVEYSINGQIPKK